MLAIDLRENAVVRPLIEEGRQEGREAGRQEGRQEGREAGRQELLLALLAEKFAALPQSALDRVHRASAEQLDRWARRILRSTSLEDTLD